MRVRVRVRVWVRVRVRDRVRDRVRVRVRVRAMASRNSCMGRAPVVNAAHCYLLLPTAGCC